MAILGDRPVGTLKAGDLTDVTGTAASGPECTSTISDWTGDTFVLPGTAFDSGRWALLGYKVESIVGLSASLVATTQAFAFASTPRAAAGFRQLVELCCGLGGLRWSLLRRWSCIAVR